VSFGAVAPYSVGVEEELFLVDAKTLETGPRFSDLREHPRIKPELIECLLETNTTVCRDASEALAQLAQLRREAAALAAERGATVVATASHPLARPGEQRIVPGERYRRMLEELGPRLKRQIVCGLHVHVAMPDPETCLRTFEAVVPWAPALLALSANSPFYDGEATGLRSTRSQRLLEMPTGGTPPVVRDWPDWERATGGDDTRRHWDVWPRPVYGTLEVRVMDQQTDVRRSVGLAALVRALCLAAPQREPCDREGYARERERAAREPADTQALRELVEPAARELGEWPLVEPLLAAAPEAERQLELGPQQALREAAARTLDFDP
jgi:carboxylate-amine ligase